MRIQIWFLVFGFWSLVGALSGQNVDWLRHSEGHSAITEMEASSDGGYYATGYMYRGMYYGSTQYYSHGADDIFLGKFDENGDVEWLEVIGSAFGDDRPLDLEVSEKDDLVCVSGYIGPEGQWNRNRLNTAASGIVICFDTQGDLAFYELLGKEGRCSTIDINDNREMLITGRGNGQDTVGGYIIGTEKEYESFLALMDIDQGFTYAETWKDDEAWTLKGNWTTKGYAVFAQGRGSLTLDSRLQIPSTQEEDVLITYFALDHQVLSQSLISGPARTQLTRVRETQTGLIFCGYNNQDSIYTLNGGLGSSWGFIGEIDDNYQVRLHPIGEGYFLPFDIIKTPSSYYLSGMYTYRASVDGITLPTHYSNEAFALKLDRDLNLQWLKTGNGPLNDYATSLAISNDRLYAGGYYGSDMTFGQLKAKNVGDFTVNLWVGAIEEVRTGTSEGSPTHELTLYPNPCQDVLSVTGSQKGKIYDSTGQCVWAGDIRHEISVEHLITGRYIFIDDLGRTVKFVKTR